MKSEINKFKEEVEKLNDQLIIVESERREAEEQEDAGTLIWKQYHWQRWQYFAKVKYIQSIIFTKQFACTQFVSFWIKLFFSVWWSSVYDQTSFSSSQCPSSFWILMASHFYSILLSPGTPYRSVEFLVQLLCQPITYLCFRCVWSRCEGSESNINCYLFVLFNVSIPRCESIWPHSLS